jgi:hypothetical protein
MNDAIKQENNIKKAEGDTNEKTKNDEKAKDNEVGK